MLCRISVSIPKRGRARRTYYTLRSDTSSWLLGYTGGHFSHFRKATSTFDRIDDGDTYHLRCRADDSLCDGELNAAMDSVSDDPPDTTTFQAVSAATEFVLDLDGSYGYNFTREALSFQEIDYPDWEVSFCHDCDLDSTLIDHLAEAYDLDLEFDCTLYMADVDQTWNRAWLYDPVEVGANPPDPHTAPATD